MDISMNIEGDKYRGGFTGSKTQQSGFSAAAEIGTNSRKMVRWRWRYQEQVMSCISQTGSVAYVVKNRRRWVPERPEGNRIDKTSATFSCGGSGPAFVDYFGARTTITRNNTATYGGFFKINGVEMNASQSDQDAQTYTIDPRPDLNAKFCGSDGNPIYAAYAKEIYPSS
jgi:hypothetical protein